MNIAFSPTIPHYFFNKDISVNISHPHFKFDTPILHNIREGTMSQISV